MDSPPSSPTLSGSPSTISTSEAAMGQQPVEEKGKETVVARMPHPDAMNRIANSCMFCEQEFLSLHWTYILFPEEIQTDEERVYVLRNDQLKRFKVKEDNIPGQYTKYYVGLLAEELNDMDKELVKGVNEWKDSMVKYLKSMPGKSIPLTNLTSHCLRPASVPRELRIKDALRVDLQERFELLGHSDMLYVGYKLSSQVTETTKENWRNNMEKFLVLSVMRKVSLATLGSSVPKPLLLKRSVKITEVISEDPSRRFVVTNADSHIAYVGLAIDELERAKEKWRLRLAMQLASPPYQCSMTTLGGAVPRPNALGRNVTLMDVIQLDPKKRFVVGGNTHQMFVRLAKIPGSKKKEGSIGAAGNKGWVGSAPVPSPGHKVDGGWTVVGGAAATAGVSKKVGGSIGGGGGGGAFAPNRVNYSTAGRCSDDGLRTNVWVPGKGMYNDITDAPAVDTARASYAVLLRPQFAHTGSSQINTSTLTKDSKLPLTYEAVSQTGAAPPGFDVSTSPSMPPGLGGAVRSSDGPASWKTEGGNEWGGVPPVHTTTDVDDAGLDIGNLLSDFKQNDGGGGLGSLGRDFFAPMSAADSVYGNDEVMPSFLKKDNKTVYSVGGSTINSAVVSPPMTRMVSAESVFLAEWLPKVLEGFPPPLITSFCDKLSEEGFISAQDLLDAQALGQLTAEYLKEACGFKLGHYNRLMKGLSSL